jgi:hypothetical protein
MAGEELLSIENIVAEVTAPPIAKRKKRHNITRNGREV